MSGDGKQVEVDRIWTNLGPWSRYQIKQYLIYGLVIVSLAFHTPAIVFICYRPNFHCKAGMNETGARFEYGECKWDFVCEKEDLAEMTQLLLLVGMMIGNCFFPTMSDRFGRKPVLVFSHICMFAFVLATSFSPNYTTFVFLCTLTGAVTQDSGLDEGGDERVRLSKDGGDLQLDALAAPTPAPDVFVEKYTICDMLKNTMVRNVSFKIYYTCALIEYPAGVFELFALVKIGRKWTCVICHGVAAIALIVATAFRYSADGHEGMMVAGTAFTLIGKMGITGAYNTLWVVTPELYPTNLRNTGFGAAWSYKIRWMPGAIYAVMCIFVVFLFAFVPETHGVEVPQTVDELTVWYRVNKFEMKIGKNRNAKKDRAGEFEEELRDVQ
ncbi:solute carrier family 22 member 6-A-like [Mya arenaria]|uniref:solute carrier family 22 member 6-A-like n=1 Tax=Mya arenaria TaxID=6604 RepID=UPI0022E62242|nr:solute carrier family 22 member 6-A-like [Mya arenaria]XP_052817951.1 solute carrier family 22 member 6-A-like [Mya arenaria]XP_052820123.1 solute carrier family 22 member 6-A-like [Mya arenaria]